LSKASRLQGQFDVYNLFKASPVTSLISRYSPTWLQPTTLLGAGLFKFGVEYSFQ